MFVLHSGTPDNIYSRHVDKVRDEDQRKDWNTGYTRDSLLYVVYGRDQKLFYDNESCNEFYYIKHTENNATL